MHKIELLGSFSKTWRVHEATIVLALILIVAAALRLWAIDHGLPFFAHVWDGEARERLVFQQDHAPVHGLLPTSTMRPGEMCKETYELSLLSNIEPGIYLIDIGSYMGGDRMKIVSSGGESVTIGQFTVVSP